MRVSDVAAPPRLGMTKTNGLWRWSVVLEDGTSAHGTATDMEQAFLLMEDVIRDNTPAELH